MESVLIVLAIMLVLFVLVVLGKHTQERDERKRKAELLKQIIEHYDGLPQVDACDVFYVSIIKQMYRSKHQGANYEHLRRDANLVLDIRNGLLENEVIQQIDRPVSNGIFRSRFYHRPLTIDH